MRLDQWLWAVRAYKTRSISATAIKGGHVKVNEAVVKPACEAKPGMIVAVRIGSFTRTLRVLGSPKSRVGAKLVPEFAEDLTPREEYEKLRALALNTSGLRDKGEGRPTKRDRRAIDSLGEGGAEIDYEDVWEMFDP